MNNILTEDGLINLDIERDLYHLNMRQKLDTVKHHPSGGDTFICPANLSDQIGTFLNAYCIPYSYTENTTGTNPEEIKRQMDRYSGLGIFQSQPGIFVTPFENNSLFEWSKQLFGDTEDPEYAKYCDYVDQVMDEYYQKHYNKN